MRGRCACLRRGWRVFLAPHLRVSGSTCWADCVSTDSETGSWMVAFCSPDRTASSCSRATSATVSRAPKRLLSYDSREWRDCALRRTMDTERSGMSRVARRCIPGILRWPRLRRVAPRLTMRFWCTTTPGSTG